MTKIIRILLKTLVFIVCTLIVLMVAAAILLNTDSVQKGITE